MNKIAIYCFIYRLGFSSFPRIYVKVLGGVTLPALLSSPNNDKFTFLKYLIMVVINISPIKTRLGFGFMKCTTWMIVS